MSLGASPDENCVCVVCGCDYWAEAHDRTGITMHKTRRGWLCGEHLTDADRPRLVERSREPPREASSLRPIVDWDSRCSRWEAFSTDHREYAEPPGGARA